MHYKSPRHEQSTVFFRRRDEKFKEAKAQIDNLLHSVREALWKVFGADADAANQAWEENNRLADEEDYANALDLIERAEKGEFAGRLVLATDMNYEKYRVVRVLPLDGASLVDSSHDCIMEYSVLNRTTVEAHHGKERMHSGSYLDFLELPLQPLAAEELTAFCRQLKRDCQVSFLRDILSALEPKITIPLEVGEKIFLGACDHHSGEIEALGVVLPTGRMAVFQSYSGEKEAVFASLGEVALWTNNAGDAWILLGIAPDPSWLPNDMSAKNVHVDAAGLTPPTDEELEFLKTGESGFEWNEEEEPPLMDETRLLKDGQDE